MAAPPFFWYDTDFSKKKSKSFPKNPKKSVFVSGRGPGSALLPVYATFRQCLINGDVRVWPRQPFFWYDTDFKKKIEKFSKKS